jgi:hypothetical protein
MIYILLMAGGLILFSLSIFVAEVTREEEKEEKVEPGESQTSEPNHLAHDATASVIETIIDSL